MLQKREDTETCRQHLTSRRTAAHCSRKFRNVCPLNLILLNSYRSIALRHLLTCVDVMIYGLNGLNNTNSSFNNSGFMYDLPAPSLNISAFPVDDAEPLPPNATYAYSNSTYDLKYLQENGSCQQLLTYIWGFSYLLLAITMSLTTLWAIGTYALWLD